MSQVNIFEQASRKKLRFETSRGQLTVEQLWDLALTGQVSLDSIAIDLNTQLTNLPPVSFVTDSATNDPVLTLKFDIIKQVIATRVEENKKKSAAQEVAQQRKLLREQIALEKNKELLSGDVSSLEKKLAALGDE